MAVLPRLYRNWDERRAFGEWYPRADYLAAQASVNGSRPYLATVRLTMRNGSGQERTYTYTASGGAMGDGRYRDDTHIRWEGKEIVAAEAGPDGPFVVMKRWPMPWPNDKKVRWKFEHVAGTSWGAIVGVDLMPTPKQPKPPRPPDPPPSMLFWRMAVDNHFRLYLSESAFEPGTLLTTGDQWNQFYTGSTLLTGQVRRWLHVDASDDGIIAGFLGHFWITGGGYTFGDGKSENFTNTRPWVVSRFAFGQQLEEPSLIFPLPPASDMADELSPAEWIWTRTNGNVDVGSNTNPPDSWLHRYFSLEILPAGYDPPQTGVSWWEIKSIAKRGIWVRRLAWDPERRLTYSRDFGSTRAVAIIDDSLGQRVVQNSDFGLAEFLSRDWVRA